MRPAAAKRRAKAANALENQKIMKNRYFDQPEKAAESLVSEACHTLRQGDAPCPRRHRRGAADSRSAEKRSAFRQISLNEEAEPPPAESGRIPAGKLE